MIPLLAEIAAYPGLEDSADEKTDAWKKIFGPVSDSTRTPLMVMPALSRHPLNGPEKANSGCARLTALKIV